MNINTVTEIINQKGFKAEVQEITKGSAARIGIVIGDGNIRPTIYPDSIMAETEEEMADKAISLYEANKLPGFDISRITEADYIKENMFVSVRRPIEDNAFVKSFLDIQLVLRAKVQDPNGTFASYIVKKDLAEKCGFDESIFDEAIKNMEFEFKPLGSLDADDVPECGIYVVSTEDSLFGAAAIFDKVFLKSIAELLNSDLTIIPSSVHELLIVKHDSDNVSSLNQMVVEVNYTQVKAEEQLADHVYIFHKNDNSIEY